MASARISFEIEGKKHTLYFGMSSVRIFQEKSAGEYIRLVNSGIEKPTQDDYDNNLVFAFLVHSGLCNMADINDEQRPLFIDSYSLSEEISRNEELTLKINEVWNESQPVIEMSERLKNKLNEGEKKSPKRTTGKKSKHLPTES